MTVKSPKPATTKTAVETTKKTVKEATSPAPASPKKRPASEAASVKPKKALSAYFIWLNEVGRKDIIAKQFGGSGKDVAAIAKAAGVAWGAMSDADKKPWNEKAEKDKERHANEMKTYVPSESSEPKKKKGKKGKKDPNKPKRGLSAYFFFGKDVRADVIKNECKGDGSKVTEVMKAIGVRWGKVDAKGREKYEKLAEADKERYAKEMAEYKKNSGGDDDDDDDDEEDEE